MLVQVSNNSLAAIAHMIQPINTSSICQDRGRAKTGRSNWAPYPSAKKKLNEAMMAPAEKYSSSSANCADIDPSNIHFANCYIFNAI